MHLRLVEPSGEGHHIALYARNIAREATQRGWDVSLATTEECLQHPSAVRFRCELPSVAILPILDAVEFPREAPTQVNLLRYQFSQARTFRAAAIAGPTPDVIYVVNLDYCDKAVALRGSPFGDIPFAGMLMATRFHHHRMGVTTPVQRFSFLHEWMFERLLAVQQLGRLLTIDETLSAYAETRAQKGFRKVQYVHDMATPHPAVTRSTARAHLGLSHERAVVLLYGTLSLRKGLRPLLETLAFEPRLSGACVLLVGVPDDGARTFLAGPAAQRLREEGRLVEHLRFVTEEEAAEAFTACDVVWLGYENFFGMSGVLVQAARSGVPILATNEGLIGWLTQRHGLGRTVAVRDRMSVCSALMALLHDQTVRHQAVRQGVMLGARHDATSSASAICDAIVETLETA